LSEKPAAIRRHRHKGFAVFFPPFFVGGGVGAEFLSREPAQLDSRAPLDKFIWIAQLATIRSPAGLSPMRPSSPKPMRRTKGSELVSNGASSFTVRLLRNRVKAVDTTGRFVDWKKWMSSGRVYCLVSINITAAPAATVSSATSLR
jgi:hypothetical protein